MGGGDLAPIDRVYVDALCPRIALKEPSDNDSNVEDKDDTDVDKEEVDKSNGPLRYISAFLRYLYWCNYAGDQGVSKFVTGLAGRLQELGSMYASNQTSP